MTLCTHTHCHTHTLTIHTHTQCVYTHRYMITIHTLTIHVCAHTLYVCAHTHTHTHTLCLRLLGTVLTIHTQVTIHTHTHTHKLTLNDFLKKWTLQAELLYCMCSCVMDGWEKRLAYMQFVIDLISRCQSVHDTLTAMSYSDAVNYILQVIVDVIVYGECVCVW